jgi:putative colanic acid biosynthesis glycosyltransferase
MARIELSIVTVTLNNKEGLRKTMNSTVNMISGRYQIEHLIIDGNSTDGTPAFVRRLADNNDSIKIYSESDSGIYNAMNKGIRRARGTYIMFLNSGDEMVEQSPDTVLSLCLMARRGNHQLLCCDYQFENIALKYVQLNEARATSLSFPRMPTSHQAMIYQRSYMLEHEYDESFRVSGDFEHFCRFLKNRASWIRVPITLSRFYSGGVSSSNKRTLFYESSRTISKFSAIKILIPIRILVLWLRIYVK